MPSPRRRGRSPRSSYESNYYPLVNDLVLAGDVEYQSEAERRAAWREHGPRIMAEWLDDPWLNSAGCRPHAWWRFDAPADYDPSKSGEEQLRGWGMLLEHEESIIRARDRRAAAAKHKAAARTEKLQKSLESGAGAV